MNVYKQLCCVSYYGCHAASGHPDPKNRRANLNALARLRSWKCVGYTETERKMVTRTVIDTIAHNWFKPKIDDQCVSDERKVYSFLDYSYIRLTRREVK